MFKCCCVPARCITGLCFNEPRSKPSNSKVFVSMVLQIIVVFLSDRNMLRSMIELG